ncbi:MAG: endonuclease III [Bacilli bacterium]|nr:endonuclease III [Bacilli bacterium]
MTKKIKDLTTFLDEIFPNVGCELIYHHDYELVIAVMLSAQTTDKSVNKVTQVLFSHFPSLDALANASIKDVQEDIHSIGLYKNKANNVIGIAKKLISDFSYQVPSDKELLQTLPGVGNKTAGVIITEIFKIPDLPVDTHILRIAKRLKFVKENATPLEVEKILKKLIDESSWIKIHHQLIHFGRYFCLARNPNCENCKLRSYCGKK